LNALFSTPLTEALLAKISNNWRQTRKRDFVCLFSNIFSSNMLGFWDTKTWPNRL